MTPSIEPWTPRRLLIAGWKQERLSRYLCARRPDLDVRLRNPADVTPADCVWADAYVGPGPPAHDGLGAVRWVHTPFAGVDAFLFRREWPPGTLLTRTTGLFGPRVGEFCLARALAAAQRLPALWEAQRRHRWHQQQVRPLRDSRVLVVGTGDIGRGVGRAFAAVGCVVDGASLRGRACEPFREVYPAARLREAVAGTDWIVLTLPLTEQTLGLFDRAVLSRCEGAFLINVGRGPVVDEAALIEALQSGLLRGAALDVFETEPLPDASPLWDHPRVILSPHMAALTTIEEAGESFLAGLADLEAGIRPRLAVDVTRGY